MVLSRFVGPLGLTLSLFSVKDSGWSRTKVKLYEITSWRPIYNRPTISVLDSDPVKNSVVDRTPPSTSDTYFLSSERRSFYYRLFLPVPSMYSSEIWLKWFC